MKPHDKICMERQAEGECPMQTVFLSHGIKPRAPMTYQSKLALAIAAFFAALLLLSGIRLMVTAAAQQPVFPDIIATQPSIETHHSH